MTSRNEYQWRIEQLLHRRTDLSTFVIHWTRDCSEGALAKDNLLNILLTRTIGARTPMGPAVNTLERLLGEGRLSPEEVKQALNSQKVVCFTEAPLEQAWSFVSPIAGRQHQLQPFGLAFTKSRAREMGVNPVWYTDMTPGRGHDWLIREVECLVERATQRVPADFADDPIAKIAPFVDWMGSWDDSKKEFWWEREWRHRGDLQFSLDDVAVVLCPEPDMEDFAPHTRSDAGRNVSTIDPAWGLERIIAELAGASTC